MIFVICQVIYACREYACTAVDILARRTRLAFLNVHAAEEALPKVIQIMARELGWSEARQQVIGIIQWCFTVSSFSKTLA
jgi:glycerol-3-phosphate dehydrogenase